MSGGAPKRGLFGRFEDGLNGIVYFIQKDIFYSKLFYLAALVQGFSIVSAAFTDRFAWSDRVVSGSGVRSAMQVVSLDALQVSEALFIAVFGLVLALALASAALVAFIGFALSKGSAPPLKVSLALQRIISLQIAFQGPIVGLLAAVCECGSGPDGTDAPGWRGDCTADGGSASLFSLGLLGLVTVATFVLVFSRMHSRNPLAFDPTTRAITWIDTLYSAVQIFVAIAFRLDSGGREVVLALAYTVANGVMAALVAGLVPFYRREMNSFRVSIHSVCTWTGACLVAVAASANPDDDIPSAVWITGVVPVAVWSYQASARRRDSLVRRGRARAALLARRATRCAEGDSTPLIDAGPASQQPQQPPAAPVAGGLFDVQPATPHAEAASSSEAGASVANREESEGRLLTSDVDVELGLASDAASARMFDLAGAPLEEPLDVGSLPDHVERVAEDSMFETLGASFGAYLADVGVRFVALRNGRKPSPQVVDEADLLYRESLVRFPQSEFLIMRYIDFLILFKEDLMLANLLVSRCLAVEWQSAETRADVVRLHKDLSRLRQSADAVQGSSGTRVKGGGMDVITHEEVVKALKRTRRDHKTSRKNVDKIFALMEAASLSESSTHMQQLAALVSKQATIQLHALDRYGFLFEHVPQNKQMQASFASFVEDSMLDPESAQQLREDIKAPTASTGSSSRASSSHGGGAAASTLFSKVTSTQEGLKRVADITQRKEAVKKKLRKHATKMRAVTFLLLASIVAVAIVYTTRTWTLPRRGRRRSAPPNRFSRARLLGR